MINTNILHDFLKSAYLFIYAYILIDDIEYLGLIGQSVIEVVGLVLGGYGCYTYNQLLLLLTSLKISFG